MLTTVINSLLTFAYWICAHNLDLLFEPYFQSFSAAPIVSASYINVVRDRKSVV